MPVKRRPEDILFSEVVRLVGRCEAEAVGGRPCSNQLQAAHIVTRGRAATRTDTRNAFCLCFAHHRYFHDYPREFSRFITGTWAQQYYELIYQKSVTPTKVNWADRIAFLKEVKRAILAGELTIEGARELEDD